MKRLNRQGRQGIDNMLDTNELMRHHGIKLLKQSVWCEMNEERRTSACHAISTYNESGRRWCDEKRWNSKPSASWSDETFGTSRGDVV